MMPKLLTPTVFGRPVPVPLVAWLTLIWVMLWGSVSALTLVGGVLAGTLTVWLLPLPVLDPGIRFRPVPFAAFLAWFALDLVSSTARVVFWVLHPGRPPTGVVRVPLRTSSESMIMMVMVALSTVPGSLVLEFQRERRELVVHILGRRGNLAELGREEVAGLESRIVAAFGTSADRRELG
ncbi:Na+/H+ antiporter subunit E [Nonomuraea sp. SBT364]|uniref:Na+/H+ antiporter subunit E n=1 Tax=Nonomuraea sp. SBT364 TaxID=1580530 RepID=UPI00066EC826|nr:Na+/H+ antiporter subunit E [Nonomuraea sp. SBT364]